MNHELLFSENAFQKTLVSPGNNAAYKKDRSAFHADNSSRADHDKFAEYLNANKNKSDTPRSKTSSSENNKADAQSKANEAAKFATQKSKIHGEETDVEDIIGFAGLDVDSITALQEEIQRLIAEQSNAGDETDAQTDTEAAALLITTDAETDDDTQSTDNLFALIASLLNESGEQKGVKESDGTNNNDFMALLGKIKDAVENGDIPSLTSGLTIEQLTALDENLDAYVQGKLSKEEEELLETLAAQWVTLAPPSTARSANKTSEEEVRIKSDMAAALKQPKSDTANAKPITTEERHYSNARYDARYSAEGNVTDNTADTSKADIDFKTTLKAESGQNTQAQQQTANNTSSAAERFLQSSSVLNALPALDSSAQGSQAIGLTQAAIQGQANNPLTSVITQSQNATQAHPATQMVSATIQKAVKAGEDTNIKLRLDPPELGRVEVKMSIDKDNMAKIVLTVEKPETFMMLQKDSHVLQQALYESGVDTQGDISFELASDNQDFGRDGNQQNGSHSSGRKSSDSEDGTLMQTTMDWQVDPDTGHMRYNILA